MVYHKNWQAIATPYGHCDMPACLLHVGYQVRSELNVLATGTSAREPYRSSLSGRVGPWRGCRYDPGPGTFRYDPHSLRVDRRTVYSAGDVTRSIASRSRLDEICHSQGTQT